MKTPIRTLVIFFHFVSFVYANKPAIIAHRGASSLAPENTLASFKKAAELKADYFELDVYYSLDDSLMVIHDVAVDRTSNGRGNIHDLTYGQLKQMDFGSWFNSSFKDERIPTLYESLRLAKESDIKVCIHVYEKDKTVVQRIVDLISSMGMESRVIIFSFDYNQIKQFKSIGKAIPTLYLVGDLAPNLIDSVYYGNIDYLGVTTVSSKAMTRLVHLNERKLMVWTVDDTASMKVLINYEVDGIITNFPQYLRPLIYNTTSMLERSIADKIILFQNYPNPFNLLTSINYYLPFRGHCKLKIYNVLGKELSEIDKGMLDPGNHTLYFEGDNLASGNYYYSLYVEDEHKLNVRLLTKWMSILK